MRHTHSPRPAIAMASALVAALAGTPASAGAQPPLTNGRIETRTMAGALEQEVRTLSAGRTEPAWLGYAAPARDGDHHSCCWNGTGAECCAGCRLEPGATGTVTGPVPSPGPIALEPADTIFVLARLEGGTVSRIRIFSSGCPLDLGGRTLHWLSGVSERASVDWLSRFTTAGAPNRLLDSALAALAMHRSPLALEHLLATARNGTTAHARGQALFWLAQRAGDQAVGAISEAIASDPETDVKRRAVFALSQLPKDQGVPLLIGVARTHANPAVRKQAMFWLGQSRDPRALQFFQDILFK